MSFNWREYLELAKAFSGMPNSGYSEEALHRSAVSRAYYAAFCWCRNFAQQNLGFKATGTAEDHKLLREHLMKKGGKWKNIASHLNKLRGWRNSCDYDDEVPGLSNMLKESIRLSTQIINKCK